ncbi:putative nucleotidyltransferase, Ribonuclease H [Helianthus annuus]|nr:putative nucleotidyltransferase, Ribonuclease H [Helianthus annuus]
MAEGTRFRVLEESLKSVQDDNRSFRTELDAVVSAIASVQSSINELIRRSDPNSGDANKGFSSGGAGSSSIGRHKPAPVYLARFNGDHPERWLAQAVRYFDFYSISEADRLSIASFYLDDGAAEWYDWLQRHHRTTTWVAFSDALSKRFRSHDLEKPEGQLAKLSQSSTVADYRARFETISNRTTVPLSEEFLISCWISGLRTDIKQSVIIHQPATLEDAMDKAHLHEQRIQFEKGVGRVSVGSSKPILPNPKVPPSTTGSSSTPIAGKPSTFSPTTSNIGFKRLTPIELAQKRSQGLCYRCDEKYTWDHKCKSAPQLLFFDDDSMDSGGSLDSPTSEPSDTALADKLQVDEVKTHSTISYNALSGGCSITTLRFTGLIHGQEVQVLLDGGSTHCFVQTRIATFLKFPVESITPFSVVVGSGERLPCSGLARNVEVIIQGHSIVVDFYVLPLQGWDMVLGVSWLATLGPVVTDYATSVFQFTLAGKQVTWQGDKPVVQGIQFNGFRQLVQSDGVSQMFHLSLLPPDNTPPTYPPELQAILSKFTMVFDPPTGLPPARSQDHHIDLLPNSTPVSVRPYRYPHFQKQEIERLVQDMLKQGIIRPSTSAFSSPVLLVRKKDGTWRFCVDYRALNSITIRDRFPIPSIDELFDELHDAHYFSKLDLLAGYHQIRIAGNDSLKTAFRTHDGHYEFLVMPFGLTNAPSTFQRLMNDVFRPYLRRFILVFFDDILIYSKTWQDHLHHIELTLKVLMSNQLVAKLSKCLFGQTSVSYLGHVISSLGVAVDPDKILAIQQWPIPKTVKEVRSFLGLTGYYRRFIKNYASIAGPLTDLLRRDAFNWNDTTLAAFTHLKELLSSTPILRLPDFSKPFVLETDASGIGIGAVLSQDKHPLAYFSKKLCPRMQQASTYHREMYAITQAIAKWRQYLLGHKFTIITDQQSLKRLQDQVIQTPEQQKWLGKLLGFDFDIMYRPGSQNSAADALSRVPTGHLLAISAPVPSLLQDLATATKTDPDLTNLLRRLTEDPTALPDHAIKNGLLLFQGRLMVPNHQRLRDQLLVEHHSSPLGGHSGVTRTYQRLAASFYWKHMRASVKTFVANCQVCQQNKPSFLSPAGLLQPLPIPQSVFEDIAMDFITCLPVSHGKTVIMVVVDRLSKYGHFIALPSSFTSVTVATAFITEIVRLHGVPLTIVTDRDARFMTEFWKELHRLSGTILKYSTAYHPQTDGQSEALNRCLEMYLRCFVADNPNKWVHFLPWAEFWYNTSYQTSSQMTPFEVLYGRKPPSLTRYVRDSTTDTTLEEQFLERDQVLSLLKINLLKAQHRMKLTADKHRRDIHFQIDDWVFVKLQPYRQGSVRLQRHHKLGHRYFGPYRIIAKVGAVAYKLDLPATAKIHPVFHVSLLRKCLGKPTQQVTPLNLVDSTSTLILHPVKVLQSRSITKGTQVIAQSLIQWDGLSEDEATWEDNSQLRLQFPNLHLEDKVGVNGDGIVMSPSNPNGPMTNEDPTKVNLRQENGKRIRAKPKKFQDYHLLTTSARV